MRYLIAILLTGCTVNLGAPDVDEPFAALRPRITLADDAATPDASPLVTSLDEGREPMPPEAIEDLVAEVLDEITVEDAGAACAVALDTATPCAGVCVGACTGACSRLVDDMCAGQCSGACEGVCVDDACDDSDAGIDLNSTMSR